VATPFMSRSRCSHDGNMTRLCVFASVFAAGFPVFPSTSCHPMARTPAGTGLRLSTERGLEQAHSFTSEPIAKALVDAHRRGLKVRVILDRSQRTEKYSWADFVAQGSGKWSVHGIVI
jgi:hypothetical protein